MNDTLQYLINVSAIWLLSLLVFDLILKKETFHTYNRLYLLGSCVLGIVLPLWQWPQDAVQTGTISFSTPLLQRSTAMQQTIANSDTASTIMSVQDVLTGIYLCGVAVFILLLVKEVIVLISTYNKGDRSKDGVWTIVETGKDHTPYSAFRIVFINSKSNYTEEQLRIILTHEEQHGHLLHFIDLLLMQAARVAFWFHPLVYLYAERLSIVHEYQADAAVDKAPKEYGMFLIEQSILRSAPALSHSFNRSPIKKRIHMLTRHSSAFAKSKTLIALPLLLVCVLCFSKNAFSNERKMTENKVTYRGNVIAFEILLPDANIDTVMVVDAETGKEAMVFSRRDDTFYRPQTLNSEKIFMTQEIDRMVANGIRGTYKARVSGNEINIYLLENLKPELKKLKDGDYYIDLREVIIDKNGKIVYFTTDGLAIPTYSKTSVAPALQAQFVRKITTLLDNAPAYGSAAAEKKHVNFMMDNFYSFFTIKNGIVTAINN